jgi:hypothetical protein
LNNTKLFEKERALLQWGRWIFDPETFSLVTRDINGQKIFSLPLKRCISSADVLDWIASIFYKTWASNKDIGDLFEALNELLNFQSNFSSSGKESFNENGEYFKRRIEQKIRMNFVNNNKNPNNKRG